MIEDGGGGAGDGRGTAGSVRGGVSFQRKYEFATEAGIMFYSFSKRILASKFSILGFAGGEEWRKGGVKS